MALFAPKYLFHRVQEISPEFLQELGVSSRSATNEQSTTIAVCRELPITLLPRGPDEVDGRPGNQVTPLPDPTDHLRPGGHHGFPFEQALEKGIQRHTLLRRPMLESLADTRIYVSDLDQDTHPYIVHDIQDVFNG